MKETMFTQKTVSRIKRNGAQCVHHENEQPTIVVWTTVHCSIASSISSGLIMSLPLFRTCFRWSTSSIFWRYTSCCRAPHPKQSSRQD